jgi:hypothetical protein
MGWSKSDYEGRVCWEQNGKRVFDMADIEKLEKPASPHIHKPAFPYIHARIIIIGFVIGLLIGLSIGQIF